jgi:hypothetical protein
MAIRWHSERPCLLAHEAYCSTEARLVYYIFFVQQIAVTDSSSGIQLVDCPIIFAEFDSRSLRIVEGG